MMMMIGHLQSYCAFNMIEMSFALSNDFEFFNKCC